MREMTGTEIMSRRASDFTYQYSSPKLVKSRSNMELTSHGRSIHRSDKGQEKHSHFGQKSTDKTTNNNNNSRRSHRVGHRGSDALPKTTRSRTKEVHGAAENPETSKTAISTSLLPPISGHQIPNPNLKNGAGLSPRNVESSAPTRMGIRNSTSPEDVPGKFHENLQPHPGLELNPQTPPITGSCLMRSGSSANNPINFVRAAQVTSPESPKIADSSRLSPINNHDKPKVKFEKKVGKQLVDDSMPCSPRTYKLSSAELVSQQQQQPPPSRDSKTKQRRPSVKSLPKIVPSEEPFSVRRKIEQFRKWHEEHYADAFKSSPPEEETSEALKNEESEQVSDGVDFTKILENNIVQNRLSTTDVDATEQVTGCNTNQDINGNDIIEKSKNSSSKTNVKSKLRPKSGATWKTWRDVNQSDAYDDVKKYIKDNELMDEDREKWIRTWICDVKTAMEESGDVFVDK